MKAIIEHPGTTKDTKPRPWQVPVNLVELLRLSSALSAAKQDGVESDLVLKAKKLMRTKRAEARLVMLYRACEERQDIGEHELLMLLFVINSDFDQAADFRLIDIVARQQSFQCLIDMRPIGKDCLA